MAQRAVLMRLLQVLLKYPLMIVAALARKSWELLLKPVLRKLIQLRGSGAVGAAAASAGLAGGELPGGSY